MFLDRWTVPIKPGSMEAAVRLCKAEIERSHMPSSRLYTAFYGPLDVLLGDSTAESQEAVEQSSSCGPIGWPGQSPRSDAYPISWRLG
jgi:hypothetical protein